MKENYEIGEYYDNKKVQVFYDYFKGDFIELCVGVGTNGEHCDHAQAKTILSFSSGQELCMNVYADGRAIEMVKDLKIVFTGNDEVKTVVEALEFAAKTLKEQIKYV